MDAVIGNPSSGRKHGWRDLRNILLVVGALLLFAALGVAAHWWQTRHSKQSAAAPPKLTAAQTAQQDRLRGDSTSALFTIDNALKATATTSDQRYQLYIQKGNVYTDASDWTNALAAYNQAAAIQRTNEVEQLLGVTYAQLGDKQKAIDAYRAAASLIPSSDPVANDEKAVLEQKIQALGGQP
ncbi:MAG TPA: tetratricopeptide repeat protein [Candidatus Saccharimonadales bacterium]|nr:tetratricopeptide repeat protein [Candidatus Saccharimonadales bacterium]